MNPPPPFRGIATNCLNIHSHGHLQCFSYKVSLCTVTGVTFDPHLCRFCRCQAGLAIYIVTSLLSPSFLCKAGRCIFIIIEEKRRTVNPPSRRRLKQNPSKLYSYIYFFRCVKTVSKPQENIPASCSSSLSSTRPACSTCPPSAWSGSISLCTPSPAPWPPG